MLESEKAITFSDGEAASLWRREHDDDDVYKLSDGAVLLTVQSPSGPGNTGVIGQESFDDLSEAAQAAVSAYYEEQGLLYNTQQELEAAYAEYLSCKESGTDYHERRVSQDITAVASNENIMSFITSVILPVEGQIVREIHLGAVFDRDTGEALSNWDLFALPEEEARSFILNEIEADDPTLKKKWKQL